MVRGAVGQPPGLERPPFVAARTRPAGRDDVETSRQLAGGRLIVDPPAAEMRPGLLGGSLDRESYGRDPLPALQELLPAQQDRVIGPRILVDWDPQRAGQLPQAGKAHLYAEPGRERRARRARRHVQCG